MRHEMKLQHKAVKSDSVIEWVNRPLNFFSDHFFIHGGFDSTISTEIVPAFIRDIEAKKTLKDPHLPTLYQTEQDQYINNNKEKIKILVERFFLDVG